MNGKNGTDQKNYLDFSKKISVLRKLVRMDLLSEDEYILVKNRILDFHHINETEYFPNGMQKPAA